MMMRPESASGEDEPASLPAVYNFLVRGDLPAMKTVKPKRSSMRPKRTVILPHPGYQPEKSELQERIKLDVPGKTLDEWASSFA